MTFRDLHLLIRSPKDFLYSFLIPSSNRVKILPFNPQAEKYGRLVMLQMQHLCPTLKVYLVGSTGLHICGRGDIDIYAVDDPSKFPSIIIQLSPIFGAPTKIRRKFIEWKSRIKGFDVELVLIDPKEKRFKDQIKLFSLLRDNPRLLKEYADLKNSCASMTEKEYVRQRMEFFNKIMCDIM